MAKATKVINRITLSDEERRRIELEDIERTLLENKEVIKETFEVMKGMQDRGILSMVNSLLKEGDKVLNILVKTADTPETANTLKNLLLILGTLGSLNVQQLEPLILKVNSGIARVAEAGKTPDKPSYLALMRSLNDQEVKQAMTFLMTFLKGMGEDTSGLERTTQLPENQQLHKANETADIERPTTRKSYGSSIPSEGGREKKRYTSWFWIAAGVSLVTIPLTLSRRKK
ncbi:DUF1641 domain-containing protein [Peribacillus simplex]|nr:DUF1641 domain-containing protein [Brevibacillus sp. JNUCC-41]QOS89425.1 DUF1641 domain-containing protein [Brevibacillus sp. JNUCC-41]